MAKADIWMPLFIGDYLADTTRLTTVQHGAYMLLIMDYWRNGAPPDDDQILCSITKMNAKEFKSIKSSVMGLFQLADGEWRHKRIDEELKEADLRKKKSEEKAKKAAEARWGKVSHEHKESEGPSNAPSISQAMHEECPLPSQSPLPLKTLKSKAESALASRLPADWMPSVNDEDFLRLERPDLLVDATASRFRDYWIAQPGVKGRKVDWPATWRNWVRNERPQVKQQGKPDKFDPTAYVNRNAPRAPT
jgi:uncharacterized protein YdaU (DUF1376 family)